jgi:hypothetical protein
VLAQTQAGSISGTITDPNGAVVPGANIVATQITTGRQYTVSSTQAGLYVFADLPTGPYTITVKQTGFKTFVQTGIEVRVGLRESIDIKLDLGTVQQTVEVKSTAPLLETANATRGENISPQTLTNLPLFTTGLRTANSYIGYMAGVNGNGETSINGSTGRASELLIDGATITNPESGGVDFTFPGFEAFSEVKLVTSGFQAEDGRVGGGIQEYVSKSGTNKVHGDAFFNFNRQIFNANSWSNNQILRTPGNMGSFTCGYVPVVQQKACRPKSRYNEEGGSAGGPIYLPKIYDGRNRTFFYFTWVGFWQPAIPSVQTGETTPTAAMLQGNFQGLYSDAGATPHIFDPATTSGGARQPFGTAGAYNIIPTARFSAIAKNIIPFIPAPNIGSGLIGNYAFQNTTVVKDGTWSIKIDHNIKTRNRIAFFYTHRFNTSNQVLYFPGPLSDGLDSPNAPRHTRVNEDFSINAHWLVHSYWGLSQEEQAWTNPLQAGYASKFGFNNVPAGSWADATPVIAFQTDMTVPSGLGNQTPTLPCQTCLTWGMDQGKVNEGGQINWSTEAGQNVTWLHGKHEFKMGWDIRRMRTFGHDWATTNGTYLFNAAQTAGSSATTSTTGNSFASFLLGDVNGAGAAALPVFYGATRYGYHAGFFQDTWRLFPKLTLNLGLRYEVPIGWHNVNGDYSMFNPSTPNPQAGNLPGALVFMGSGPGRLGALRPYPTDFSDLGPRAGFAWQMTNSLVVRTSFGVFYEGLGNGGCGCEDGFGGTFLQQSDGFNPAFQWDGTGGQSGVHPPSTFKVPPVISGGFDNFNGGLYYMGPHYGKAPRIYDWNVTIQKTYRNWLFEGAYVGNRAHGLSSSEFINTLPVSDLYLNTVTGAGGAPENLLGLNITNPDICTYSTAIGCTMGIPNQPFPGFAQGWGGGATLAQALRPFPQVGTVYSSNSGDGRIWYDSFQAKVERRFGDLNMTTTYVFSKTLDIMAYRQIFTQCCQEQTQDAYNIKDAKTFDQSDIPHVVNFLASYSLPVGRGKKFLGSSNGVMDRLLGGWIVSGYGQYRSGLLAQITSPANNLGSYLFDPLTKANFTGTAVRTGVSSGSLDPDNASVRWFTPTATGSASFVQAPLGTIGNTSIYNTNFRQPWYRYEAISVNKEIKVWEAVQLKYSLNMFNPFNRTAFGGVNTTLNSANFGRPTGPQDGARTITMGLRLEF